MIMKSYDDSKIYFIFAVTTLVLAIILGSIASYSIFVIEPEAEGLLAAREDISENYKKAYLILRDPQIFARYENFDGMARAIKDIIATFDKKVYEGNFFIEDEKRYLDKLMERRMLGSRLTRNTMVFFLILSIMGWLMLLSEKRQVAANPE